MHRDGKTLIQRVRVDAGLTRGSLFAAGRRDCAYRFYALANNHCLEVCRADDGSLLLNLVRLPDHVRATRLCERAVREVEIPMPPYPATSSRRMTARGTCHSRRCTRVDAVLVDGRVMGRVDQVSAIGNKPDVTVHPHTDAAKAKEAGRIRIRNASDLLIRLQFISCHSSGGGSP